MLSRHSFTLPPRPLTRWPAEFNFVRWCNDFPGKPKSSLFSVRSNIFATRDAVHETLTLVGWLRLHIYPPSQNPSKPNIDAAFNDFRHRNAFANSAVRLHRILSDRLSVAFNYGAHTQRPAWATCTPRCPQLLRTVEPNVICEPVFTPTFDYLMSCTF